MSSKINIPSKVNEMSMKSLVGRRMSKKAKFMGEEVLVNKLSVSEVMEIQEKAKNSVEEQGLELLKLVIKLSVDEAKDLEDTDFDSFPLDELSKLAEEVMKFSGINQGKSN